MKKVLFTIAMTLTIVSMVSCNKQEAQNRKGVQNKVMEQNEADAAFEPVWCKVAEESTTTDKYSIIDALFYVHGSSIYVIIEPGNPELGVIRQDDPGAAKLTSRIQQILKSKMDIMHSTDKNERDEWAQKMESNGMHVVVWMDEYGIYYAKAFTDEEWCKLTGLGC